MKKTATQLRLEAYLAPQRDNLKQPEHYAGILSDATVALHDAIESTDDEAVVEQMIGDYFEERKTHYFKTRVRIPADLAAQAFGNPPSLAAQGRMVKQYGEEAAAEEARRWNTKLGATSGGRHPDSGGTEAKPVVRESDREAPNKNPWHPKWNGKDRVAAQTSIIRSLGSKVAAALARSAGVTLSGHPLKK
jgi:hypothetical protein